MWAIVSHTRAHIRLDVDLTVKKSPQTTGFPLLSSPIGFPLVLLLPEYFCQEALPTCSLAAPPRALQTKISPHSELRFWIWAQRWKAEVLGFLPLCSNLPSSVCSERHARKSNCWSINSYTHFSLAPYQWIRLRCTPPFKVYPLFFKGGVSEFGVRTLGGGILGVHFPAAAGGRKNFAFLASETMNFTVKNINLEHKIQKFSARHEAAGRIFSQCFYKYIINRLWVDYA